MAGYYTEYFSTLLKGPWALSFKQRWDSKRVVLNAKKADKLIYEKLPEKVEVEHRVTSAGNDQKKAINAMDESIRYGLHLAFNSSYEDEVILRNIKHLIESFEKIHQVLEKMKRDKSLFTDTTIKRVEPELEALSKKFVLMIIRQTAKAEKEEKEEMREVMGLINEAHKIKAEEFTTRVRAAFTKLQTQTALARFALYADINHEKRLVIRLGNLSKKLEEIKGRFERIVNNIKARKHELPKVLAEFKKIVEESEKDIEGAFLYSYRIKKRDFRIMLAMLVNAEVLRNLNVKWVRMHFMPAVPVEARLKDIENLEKKVSGKMHIVAQALRIDINANQDIKRKATPLFAS